MPLLRALRAADALAPPRLVLTGTTRLAEARRAVDDAGVPGAPVVDEHGRFEGVVSVATLRAADPDAELRASVDAAAPVVAAATRLDDALDALSGEDVAFVSVLDAEHRVLGTLSLSDVVRAYRRELRVRAERDQRPQSRAAPTQLPAA
jgi:CBS domain-containing protein